MWQIRGVLLWLVALSDRFITASLFCCAVHVSCVRCVARLARREIKEYGSLVLQYGQMVTMPDFGFDGVSSSLAEVLSIKKKKKKKNIFFCIMYVTQTPQTTQHTSSAGCVLQPAGYNAIHACRLPAEQEATPHTRAVVLSLIHI